MQVIATTAAPQAIGPYAQAIVVDGGQILPESLDAVAG